MPFSPPTDLYRFFGDDGTLLYVGVSLNPIMRLSQHASLSPWYDRAATVRIEKFNSRTEALRAERKAIAEEHPIHNVLRPRTREEHPIHNVLRPRTREEHPEAIIRDDYQRVKSYLLRTLANTRCFTSPEMNFWYKVVFFTPLGCLRTDSNHSEYQTHRNAQRIVEYNKMSEVPAKAVIENWANEEKIWERFKQDMVFYHWIMGDSD